MEKVLEIFLAAVSPTVALSYVALGCVIAVWLFNKMLKEQTRRYLRSYAEKRGIIYRERQQFDELLSALRRNSSLEKQIYESYALYVADDGMRDQIKSLSRSCVPSYAVEPREMDSARRALDVIRERERFFDVYAHEGGSRKERLSFLVLRALWPFRPQRFLAGSSNDFLRDIEGVARCSVSIAPIRKLERLSA